jgi:branched-chain amino acid transport system ATP-binding protein
LLTVENLTIRYGAGALAIDGASLTVPPGSVVALLGPNGAGKTTTLRGISGFLRSETAVIVRGTVTWQGRNVTGFEPHRMARLGVVAIPERSKIFPNLSVFENLSALRVRSKGSRDQGLERVLELFPWIAERMKDPAGLLSGGQQQMLAIARGLLLEPEVLMIDEMTLGLHPSIHGQLFDVARKIADSGTSVLVVDEGTTSALENADVVYVMSGGKIRASGDADRFRSGGLLEELYLAG